MKECTVHSEGVGFAAGKHQSSTFAAAAKSVNPRGDLSFQGSRALPFLVYRARTTVTTVITLPSSPALPSVTSIRILNTSSLRQPASIQHGYIQFRLEHRG